jgi:GntR family transcriptional repressor for pyruvate dehydrogenase complex
VFDRREAGAHPMTTSAEEHPLASDRDAFRDFLESPLERPRQVKLAVIVAREIANDIFARGLVPGDALPNEGEMLKVLDVSRATLREALRVLETQGVIAMRTGRGGGPIVAQPSPRALADTLTVSLRSLGVTFEEILFTRDTIEPALAREAALNRTDEDLKRLRAAARSLEEAGWDSADALRLNRQFHSTVALASLNRPLAIMWAAISTVADGQEVGAEVDERLWAAGNAAHAKIVRAIEQGDPDAAERAMSVHVDAFHQEMADAHPDLLDASVRTTAPGEEGAADRRP